MRPILLDLARLFTAVYLVTMMFSMGLELGGAPHETREAKRHQRRLLARALVFNLVLLPLIAVALTKVLHSSGEVTIGFLLVAAAPGGRFTPQLSRLSGAHLGFSVELTLLLVKVVSFTAPLTVHWMLNTRPLAVHELRFIAQLIVLQLAPYLAGREVRKRWPLVAQRLGRFSEVVMWMGFGIVLGLVIAAYPLRNLPTLLGERGWWAAVAFANLAFALGWLLGGPAPEVRRAFAISANARNLALALVLASVAFSDRNVHLATFFVWLFLLILDFVFSKLVGTYPWHRGRILRHGQTEARI
jgi:BASS family bile acid:Na+ symporter